MDNPFRRGVISGLLAPLFFLAAVVFWIFRATERVPFPVAEDAQQQVTIKLIEPEHLPQYWAPWHAKLEPLIQQMQQLLGHSQQNSL